MSPFWRTIGADIPDPKPGEFDNKTTTLPSSILPQDQVNLITKLLPNWLGTNPSNTNTLPPTLWTWGPTVGHTLGVPHGATGIFEHDKLGLDRATIGDLYDYPNAPHPTEVLAHEAAHHLRFIDKGPLDKPMADTVAAFPDVLSKALVGSGYDMTSPNHEKEAMIMGKLFSDYWQVIREEQARQKSAPDLRPK